MATVERITLEDQGQDFTEWYVRDGIVIDCQPSQGGVWVGTRLIYPDGPLKAGSTIHMHAPYDGSPTILKHKVEAVATLAPDDASIVEAYGRSWAEMKGIEASKWGL